MQELYNKLKNHTITEAIKIEESDRQFIALKKLWENNYVGADLVSAQYIYLSLILANTIICYQLSWKWEDYWDEFSDYFGLPPNLPLAGEEIVIENLIIFIKQSKNNKRFIDTKIKRLKKLEVFLEDFEWKEEYYFHNMEILRDELARTMKQKKDAKTIVFAVKMFNYWARNVFNKVNCFPESISIPVDSRLTNLFEKYKWNYTDINKFYFDLSKKLDIPELHLDAIVWVNYENLMNKKRCSWLNLNNKEYITYHDNQWGVEVHDDNILFEFLVLEWAQAWLSWETILKRKDSYRQAFDDYDLEKIINYDDKKIEELLNNEWIIRNKLKVNSVIKNAKVFIKIQEEFWSFYNYIWGYVNNKQIKNHFKDQSEIPVNTELSDKVSKDLKKRWMSFVWTTIIYAYMQAVWIVNDHEKDCFRY